MTATDPRTLDDLLRAAEPVDAEPFDLGALLNTVQLDSQPYAQMARDTIARYVNSLRVDTENARRVACNLEADAARVGARIKEAIKWLERAESYSVSEDCSSAIDDAMAALRGAS